MRVLFVSSEVQPLMKTGGLADVSASLPKALNLLDQDVRILMPAYPDALATCELRSTKQIIQAGNCILLHETVLPGSAVPVWLLDVAWAFDRAGNPYLDQHGQPWSDNAHRFALLCRVAVELAQDRLGLAWRPDVVHCNDWQTGLIPVLLDAEPVRPATLFTIHNLAYQGVFPYETFRELHLPQHLWHPDALEFHGQFSFIKGGLVFADQITTVSPRYATEITSTQQGCGLEGLLHARRHVLTGILNGIDESEWSPATDVHVPMHYDADHFELKAANTAALRLETGLPEIPGVPVLALISRLVEQKGIDLIIRLLPDLLELPIQLVLLGSGQPEFESELRALAIQHPERLAVVIGYDEALAHRIEAGADMFLMPSRFEPCGLNQLYSQRYGTVPLVHAVGGLYDTVIDASPDHIAAHTATGFVFRAPKAAHLLECILRALAIWAQPRQWRQLCVTGMRKDFSWHSSAMAYKECYNLARLLKDRDQTFRSEAGLYANQDASTGLWSEIPQI